MAQSVVKVQKNKNITLPLWVIRRFHVEEGDFVRLEETREGGALETSQTHRSFSSLLLD